jgi:hypothetical protein
VDIQNKYVDDSFKLISIHFPALGASKEVNVIADKASELNAAFPIAIDNDLSAWNAYGNNAWPVAYGIDKEGNIRFKQVGPGLDAIIEVIEKLKAAG